MDGRDDPEPRDGGSLDVAPVHRRWWRSAVVITVLLAVVGTLLRVPLDGALGLGVLLAMFGAGLGHGFAPDLPHVRHPRLVGAALCTTPALYPGLTELVGHLALALVALLVVTSPGVWARLRRRLHSRPGLVGADALLAAPDVALRLQWEESTRQLGAARTPREKAGLVRLRQHILDDVLTRSGGELPGYVWNGTPGPGTDSPDGPDSPDRFPRS